MDRKILGQIGENAAADLLCAKGYKIVKRNYRSKYGEIDIIGERMGDFAFVEVKTRSNFDYGRPAESINQAKRNRIRKTAHCFLDDLKERGNMPVRYSFHVVEVVVQHMENIF